MKDITFETQIVIRMYFLSGNYIEVKASTFDTAKTMAQKVFYAFPENAWYSKRPQ